MRVWTVTFILVFSLTELYHWLAGFVAPFPVFIGAGALLAIASNVGSLPLPRSQNSPSPTAPERSQAAPQMPPKLETAKGLNAAETPELPKLDPRQNPFLQEKSISFTIRSPQSEPDG